MNDGDSFKFLHGPYQLPYHGRVCLAGSLRRTSRPFFPR